MKAVGSPRGASPQAVLETNPSRSLSEEVHRNFHRSGKNPGGSIYDQLYLVIPCDTL